MKVKSIVDEDFSNYKKPSMFICTTLCTQKCGSSCQNKGLYNLPTITVDDNELTNRYLTNGLTTALVIGGLEPFDTFDDMLHFLYAFRKKSSDDIVIYTGYEPFEILNKLDKIIGVGCVNNGLLIIKFGRYIPERKEKYDENLGVTLASDNQHSFVFA